ncbi:MAG: DNA-processing protein DprA [Bacteroidales bacterium]|nr:DNA-processing protein DprA [Bacteroidales bacterium]MBN2821469.1 DNA-processing protein DprA [Bacteroidales bacterium]
MSSSLYHIALSMIPKVGPRLARNLVSYLGSPEAVFKEKKSTLSKVPGIGTAILNGINISEVLQNAELELKSIEEKDIKYLFYLDKLFPYRLRECDDAPILLFYKGENCFNSEKLISVVGTRRATEYGESLTSKLIEDLKLLAPDTIIVSGFAYGIDIAAHKAAMDAKLKTIAVFGHGVEQVYPSLHKRYLQGVLENGCVCSEFQHNKKPDPGNFVSRNRIIAGLTDATVVVESGEKGGALITADMANSYNRDVFAFPGRTNDKYSRGCNKLIKSNLATLIESAEDMVKFLRWDIAAKAVPIQRSMFIDLPPQEDALFQLLKDSKNMSLDDLSHLSKMPVATVSALLLNLEFKGIVRSLPGKNYVLV